MKYATVETQVKEVLADKLNIDQASIKGNSVLVEDLGLDSFGSIEMVFALEDKFNIKIVDKDIAKAKVVKDIVDYISALVTSEVAMKNEPLPKAS